MCGLRLCARRDGNRAIHHAAFGDEPAAVETLCRAGADKNARNRRRQSPLHVAVSRGNTAVAQTLLEFDAMPSLHDADGYACP